MLRVDQPEWKSIRKEWFLIDILFTFGCDVFVHFQKAHYKSGDKLNTHQILLLCVLHMSRNITEFGFVFFHIFINIL